MTRKQAVSLCLTVLLALAIVVVPLAFSGTQPGPLRQAGQGSPIALNAGEVTPAGTGMMACDGCSGGDGGPG
ncbi:MAG: hypothetical protein ACOYY3_16985 [Chloroflexota bacterium]